ncbi:CDGSH iron-sulfur domain-containing protein 3, mitochondrial [Trichoplax sp. H2]|nr:CDGSH iron-sulfur domain-containing protein 3, mitochondrial [Trichoplax sp. H2]|eukprot:RDD42572.1 CDGSH iron-sulfur domain-containing protein 3, mitochondrial [Trichoplax sp. H2]
MISHRLCRLNSTEVISASLIPKRVLLEEGKNYFWCVCGRSTKQPFCDGKHKGTSFKPIKFTVEKTGKRFLCCCKHTQNKPFCDLTHIKVMAKRITGQKM